MGAKGVNDEEGHLWYTGLTAHLKFCNIAILKYIQYVKNAAIKLFENVYGWQRYSLKAL